MKEDILEIGVILLIFFLFMGTLVVTSGSTDYPIISEPNCNGCIKTTLLHPQDDSITTDRDGNTIYVWLCTNDKHIPTKKEVIKTVRKSGLRNNKWDQEFNCVKFTKAGLAEIKKQDWESGIVINWGDGWAHMFLAINTTDGWIYVDHVPIGNPHISTCAYHIGRVSSTNGARLYTGRNQVDLYCNCS